VHFTQTYPVFYLCAKKFHSWLKCDDVLPKNSFAYYYLLIGSVIVSSIQFTIHTTIIISAKK